MALKVTLGMGVLKQTLHGEKILPKKEEKTTDDNSAGRLGHKTNPFSGDVWPATIEWRGRGMLTLKTLDKKPSEIYNRSLPVLVDASKIAQMKKK